MTGTKRATNFPAVEHPVFSPNASRFRDFNVGTERGGAVHCCAWLTCTWNAWPRTRWAFFMATVLSADASIFEMVSHAVQFLVPRVFEKLLMIANDRRCNWQLANSHHGHPERKRRLGRRSVYLAEIATPGNKGFYVSWQSGSQQVAVIFVALLGVLLSTLVPPEDMVVWGWRIPFLIGCLIIPLLFVLRYSLKETEEFEKRRSTVPSSREILLRLSQNWPIVIIGMLLVTTTTVSFYFITAYTPTFGREVLKLSNIDSLIVTCLLASPIYSGCQ
jgi:Major Facilitator Superfamily